VGSLDLPDQPDEARQAEHASAGGADRSTPKSREMPDPDERGRVYEAMRAHVSAETPAETSPGRRPDDREQQSYWDEVPRFRGMWADHERRWPERSHAAVDRSGDPPGSYRSDGGFCLNPEQHAETTDAIRKVCRAEPRISANMQAVEQENRYGGWLEGFQHKLKGEDRLKEKAAEELAAEQLEAGSRKTPAEVIRQIPDAIRSTFCFERESYVRGYYDIKERLESYGYEMYQSKNSWGSREYKGINTRWVTQEGHRFEVQFHTPESFHAKEHVTHKAYERIRNPMISDRERKELREYQREVSATIHTPDGATDIPDYEKKGL
jgi:hypothetical protein